jgi:hypothetical protein
MSDERHGPFHVHWITPPVEYGRAGGNRTFDDLQDAVRFVMEDLPAASRGTAMIDTTGGGQSVQIEEIVNRYNEGRTNQRGA